MSSRKRLTTLRVSYMLYGIGSVANFFKLLKLSRFWGKMCEYTSKDRNKRDEFISLFLDSFTFWMISILSIYIKIISSSMKKQLYASLTFNRPIVPGILNVIRRIFIQHTPCTWCRWNNQGNSKTDPQYHQDRERNRDTAPHFTRKENKASMPTALRSSESIHWSLLKQFIIICYNNVFYLAMFTTACWFVILSFLVSFGDCIWCEDALCNASHGASKS